MADVPANVSWTATPDDSHLWGFVYFDARVYGLGVSQLHVRFKKKRPAAEGGGYYPGWFGEQLYYLRDPAEGQAIADEMAAADHPGKVLHRRLISQGNRGQKVK